MVVDEDQVRGTLAERRPEHLAGVDDRGGHAPRRDEVVPGVAVLSVQEDHPEVLAVVVVGVGWNVVGQRLLAPPATAHEGSPAPALNLPSLDGGSADLSRERGKVVLVNFWATWCEPCRAEMAGLQQLDHNLSADHFELYSVDLEETPTAITPFRQFRR